MENTAYKRNNTFIASYCLRAELLVVFFFAFPFLPSDSNMLHAQSLSIVGVVKDSKEKTAIPNVIIELINEQDSVVSVILTTAKGSFEVKEISAGSYQLSAKCVGYKSSTLRIDGMKKNYDIGTIFLEEEDVILDEIVVEVKNINKYDRMVYFVSDEARSHSMDGYDLIKRLGIPDLQFDMVNKSISLLRNGGLQIRIDGVPAQQSDLNALQPQDVIRIEYINNPGIEYGDNIAAVILVKTNRKFQGLQTGTQASHALTSFLGNIYMYLNIVGKNNLLGIKLSERHLFAHGVYTNQLSRYHYPQQIVELSTTGNPERSKALNGTIQLDYNHILDSKNSFINATVKYIRSFPQQNFRTSNVYRDIQHYFADTLLTANSVHNTSLDLYLEKRFTDRSKIIANLTGTYVQSSYYRGYWKRYCQMPIYYSTTYDVDGKHYSIIGEVIFKYQMSPSTHLTIGSNNRYSDTNNSYISDYNLFPVTLRHFNSYTYAEISSKIGKLNYSLGGGYSFYEMRNNGNMKRYHFFRPRVSFGFPFLKKLYLQYSLSINPQDPSLSALSEFSQTLSEYEVSRGNPDLKPYQAYINQLFVSYKSGPTQISLVGYLQYNDKHFSSNPPFYDEVLDKFVYTQSNQKNFVHAQVRLFASHSLLSKALKLSGYLTLNHYRNNGIEYQNRYTGLLGGASVSYDQAKWGLQANYSSSITTMFNETKLTSASNVQFGGYYNVGKFRLGLTLSNLFMSEPKISSIINSREIQNQIQRFSDYTNNMVLFSISYTLNKGKRRQVIKQILNVDSDTGVVR